MTTATDHKNNLNRSKLKKDNLRSLRVETIANSAGGTAQVAVVAQPSTGFLRQADYMQPNAKGLFNNPVYPRHHGRVPVVGHPNQSPYTSSNRHGRVPVVGFSMIRLEWLDIRSVRESASAMARMESTLPSPDEFESEQQTDLMQNHLLTTTPLNATEPTAILFSTELSVNWN